MKTTVLLDFRQCADRTASTRVQVRPEVMDWLTRHAPPVDGRINWLFGRDIDKWQVQFIFDDRQTAVLFKLTFGGH